MTTQRQEIIAKLRDYDWRGLSNVGTTAYLSWEECRRIIDDLHYCEFAHAALEGVEMINNPAFQENEAYKRGVSYSADLINALRKSVADMERMADQWKADAQRYRWLRPKIYVDQQLKHLRITGVVVLEGEHWNEAFDNAVDISMQIERKIEGGKVKIEDAVMRAYEAAQEWPKGQDR